MVESFDSLINLDSTKSLSWEMTYYNEKLFNKITGSKQPEDVVTDAHFIMQLWEMMLCQDCPRGVCCTMCKFELDSELSSISSFMCLCLMCYLEEGAWHYKNKEIRKGKELESLVEFCSFQIVVDLSV